jgi:hypothetical protein
MDVMNNLLPLVGINFTDMTLYPHPTLPIPPRTVWMHPLFNKLAIIGWRSPVNGNVTVRGSLSDIQLGCGNGVAWFMDIGGKTLLSGEVKSGGEDDFDLSTPVRMGQVLYLIVDPKAGNDCGDSTAVTLTITAD